VHGHLIYLLLTAQYSDRTQEQVALAAWNSRQCSPTGGVFHQLDYMVFELPFRHVNVYKLQLSVSFKGREVTR
jgi:hypothetical protein